MQERRGARCCPPGAAAGQAYTDNTCVLCLHGGCACPCGAPWQLRCDWRLPRGGAKPLTLPSSACSRQQALLTGSAGGQLSRRTAAERSARRQQQLARSWLQLGHSWQHCLCCTSEAGFGAFQGPEHERQVYTEAHTRALGSSQHLTLVAPLRHCCLLLTLISIVRLLYSIGLHLCPWPGVCHLAMGVCVLLIHSLWGQACLGC